MFITVVLDMLALGIVIPVTPKLILDFKGGDVASAAGIAGVFGTVWAAMQFLASPILGSLSDRFGRRPVILLSNFGLGLDYLLMAVAPNLSWLFVGRAINGITSASYATAAAYIADVAPPEKRAGYFGMLGAAFGLGFVIGPAVGGVLGKIDLRLPFYVAGGLSLLNACYGLFILPESLPASKRSPFSWIKANPLGALKLLRSNKVLFILSAACACSLLAHESLPSIYVLYTGHRYQWHEQDVGLALAVVGICSTIVQASMVRPVTKRIGERRALVLGYVAGAVSFAIYGLAPTTLLFLMGIPFGAIWGLSGPALQSLMTGYVGPKEQGQLQGAVSSMRGITGMIGPLLFTQLLAIVVKESSPLQSLPGLPYLVAAVLLVLAIVIALQSSAEKGAPRAV